MISPLPTDSGRPKTDGPIEKKTRFSSALQNDAKKLCCNNSIQYKPMDRRRSGLLKHPCNSGYRGFN